MHIKAEIFGNIPIDSKQQFKAKRNICQFDHKNFRRNICVFDHKKYLYV